LDPIYKLLIVKIHLLLLILLLPFFLFSQKTETYYDYFWKPCSAENARYFSLVEKTDSGWFRKDYFLSSRTLQMQGLYEDENCKTSNGFSNFIILMAARRPYAVSFMESGKELVFPIIQME